MRAMWDFLKFWRWGRSGSGLATRSAPRPLPPRAAPGEATDPPRVARIPRATLRKPGDPSRVAVIRNSQFPVFDKPKDHA